MIINRKASFPSFSVHPPPPPPTHPSTPHPTKVSNFNNNCAVPDTSMTLSAYVLQTFLVNESILANSIFFFFQDGYHEFQDGRQIDYNLTN